MILQTKFHQSATAQAVRERAVRENSVTETT